MGNFSNKFVNPAPNKGVHKQKAEPNKWKMRTDRYIPSWLVLAMNA